MISSYKNAHELFSHVLEIEKTEIVFNFHIKIIFIGVTMKYIDILFIGYREVSLIHEGTKTKQKNIYKLDRTISLNYLCH